MSESRHGHGAYLDLWLELTADGDKAQFVDDLFRGAKPELPKDAYLQMQYVIAAGKATLAARVAPKEITELVQAARANSYTDRDYSQADFGINAQPMDGQSKRVS